MTREEAIREFRRNVENKSDIVDLFSYLIDNIKANINIVVQPSFIINKETGNLYDGTDNENNIILNVATRRVSDLSQMVEIFNKHTHVYLYTIKESVMALTSFNTGVREREISYYVRYAAYNIEKKRVEEIKEEEVYERRIRIRKWTM